MKGWLSKSRRNCLIMALILNTIGLILAILVCPHLWFWKVADEALVVIYWITMYPVITWAIYKYFRWQSTKD